MFYANFAILIVLYADIMKMGDDMNILRKKIESKEKIRGSLVSLTDPGLCEIIGAAGFDCVWVDMEHTYMSYKDVLCHLNAARSVNIPAIVRLTQDDLTVTKKVLEMGPEGIIFPMVKTAEEARKMIDMTLYPPLGNRGFGPMRAIRYGADDAKEYVDKTSLDVCRFIQIEHVNFIDELEEIVKIPYIDGFIFGPNDLSGSLGEMLDCFSSKTVSEMKRAAEILKKNNKYFGIACGMDETTIKFWSEFEPDMIFAGADWNFVYKAGNDTFKIIEKYLG